MRLGFTDIGGICAGEMGEEVTKLDLRFHYSIQDFLILDSYEFYIFDRINRIDKMVSASPTV